MSATPPLFSVLLASYDDLKLAAIGDAIAAYKHVPAADGTQQAKHCWGIVEENLPEADADRLIQCLSQAKLKAFKIDSGKVRQVPEVEFLTHGEMNTETLVGVNSKGQPMRVTRNQIDVISASVLSSTSIKTIQERQGPTAAQQLLKFGIMMATGLPIPIGGKTRIVDKKITQIELYFYLTLIMKEPAQGFRFLADTFNYSYLKERMLYNAMGNFKLLLADLHATAPNAKLSKGAQVLMANQPVTTISYDSFTDVERECCWLMSLP